MADTIPVSFRCSVCGTRLVWPDDAIETTKIACQKCGADFGTYGDLCNQANDAVVRRLESIMKETLKRRR